jgi:hypothetical protein
VVVPALPNPSIDSIKIEGLQPVAGETAASINPVTGDGRYTIENIKWFTAPAKNKPARPVNGVFAAGETYIADVKVSANDGFMFNGTAGALNIIGAATLKNIAVVGSNGKITVGEIVDFNSMPNFKEFSFRVTFILA